MQGVINAVLPFKKTPANILRRGIEYSPVGLVSAASDIKAMIQTVRYQEEKTDKAPKRTVTPAQLIDKLASGLTGSAFMAVGFLLSQLGVANGGFDYDDPEDQLAMLEGQQEYGVNFGKLGNKILGAKLFNEDVSRTMDWAAPMSMPFFVGVTLSELFNASHNKDEMEEGDLEKRIQNTLESILSITEPVFNLSMLDGVNRLFKSSYSQSKTPALDVAMNIALNYVSSFVPTSAGQLARTIDPVRRANYVESGTGFLQQFWKTFEQVQNKIPGASQNNIPYMNAFGQTQENTVPEAALENFLAPWYKSELKSGDPVIKELKRLYQETGIPDFIPETVKKSFKIGKTDYSLNDHQYAAYQKDQGEAWYNTLNDLIQTDEYQQADNATKAIMLKDVKTYATQSAKYHIDDSFKAQEWVINSMKNGDAVSAIVKNAKEENRLEYIAYTSTKLAEALDAENTEAVEMLMEALEEAHCEDNLSKVRESITNYFKPKYQKADDEEREDIEEMLMDLDVGYRASDIHKWVKSKDDEEEEDEKEEYDDSRWLNKNGENNTGSAAKPIGYVASASGTLPSRPRVTEGGSNFSDDIGQYGEGNIDLNNRRTVRNDDGSISTELSFSFYDEDTGKEVLIPTVINGKIVSEDEAIEHYYQTGEYLGMFDTPEEANEYAERLHRRQDWYYNR